MNRPEPPAVFEEPWQAQAFALTLHLHATGTFTWAQWTSALTEAIAAGAARGDGGDGGDYYDHWIAALEALTHRHGLADPAALAQRKADWVHAYLHTPHGKPVELGATTA